MMSEGFILNRFTRAQLIVTTRLREELAGVKELADLYLSIRMYQMIYAC